MLLYEKRNYIGILTLNRPAALNAINSGLLDCLYSKINAISADNALRCLIITGAGKAFAAGADISEMKDLTKQEGIEFAKRGHRAFTALENLKIPVIAAVNGYALGGGCELALCADIRIASEKAKFGQPEVSLGITPGFGGTQRMARTVNRAFAMELILTGRMLTAREALEAGLVSRVVPPETLMDEAMKLAETIAANAPIAVRASKEAIRACYMRSLSEDLEHEARLFGSCFETRDQRMAMEAFVSKTAKSEFTGE